MEKEDYTVQETPGRKGGDWKFQDLSACRLRFLERF